MLSYRTVLRSGAVAALAILVAACGGGSATEGNSGGATIAVVDGTAEISADDLEFNAATITAPADRPFTVSFTNAEALPHNFSVYTEEGGDRLVEGGIINEGETNEVRLGPLPAGEYFFVCDVHAADMTGTLVVEEPRP